MFKTLSGLTDNAFWRVSADTKTCGSPQKCACWRFMLACWLTIAYYNIISNNSQKKKQEKTQNSEGDSQMTTSFFMLQSWMLDARRRKTPGRETEKPALPCCESGG